MTFHISLPENHLEVKQKTHDFVRIENSFMPERLYERPKSCFSILCMTDIIVMLVGKEDDSSVDTMLVSLLVRWCIAINPLVVLSSDVTWASG